LAQFVAHDRKTGNPFGIVVAYAADNRNGHAHVAALFDPEHREQDWAVEAFALLISYLFMMFPLRKLYLDGADYCVERYMSALPGLLVEEGRLSSHAFYADRYVDYVTLALYREVWESQAAPIIDQLSQR
jgi:RimJ/RimL family protein N-acetyltransferase